MKHARNALAGVVALVLAVVLVLSFATTQAQTANAAAEPCVVNVQGPVAILVCGDFTTQLPLPQVTVSAPAITLPPLPAITDIIKIPGPTETVTVRVPGETETVRVPALGPTQTATVTVPGNETTRTIAGPTATATVTETAQPSATPTVTVSPSPGQLLGAGDTITPGPPQPPFFSPDIDFGDEKVTAGEVGLGTLALLALMGLALLALYGGYVLGYKDKERSDTSFMRAILDQSKLRK